MALVWGNRMARPMGSGLMSRDDGRFEGRGDPPAMQQRPMMQQERPDMQLMGRRNALQGLSRRYAPAGRGDPSPMSGFNPRFR